MREILETDVEKHWRNWHHLSFLLTTYDGYPAYAVLYWGNEKVGASFWTPEGWTDCPGTSKNVPLVLAKIEGELVHEKS